MTSLKIQKLSENRKNKISQVSWTYTQPYKLFSRIIESALEGKNSIGKQQLKFFSQILGYWLKIVLQTKEGSGEAWGVEN